MSTTGDLATPGIRMRQQLVVNARAKCDGTGKSIEVVQVVDGRASDVLSLVGYEDKDLVGLVEADGVLRARNRVKQRLATAQRKPAALVLQEGEKLVGVVIDTNGQAQVIGLVEYLLPAKHQDKNCASVTVSINGLWQLCEAPTGKQVASIVNQHGHVGIVHFDGFCLVELDPGVLALLLEDACFIVDGFVDGLSDGDCLLVANGALVKRSLVFELISAESSVISHATLLEASDMSEFGDGSNEDSSNKSSSSCSDEAAGTGGLSGVRESDSPVEESL